MNRATRRSHINQLKALIDSTIKEIEYTKTQEGGRYEHVAVVRGNRIHMEETVFRAKATLARLLLEELET